MSLLKLFCLAAVAVIAGVSQASAQQFSGAGFGCFEYLNGQGENSAGRMQSNLARLWIYGYLAGHYKAQGKLEIGDPADAAADAAALDALIVETCKEYPQNSILAVTSKSLALEPRKMPSLVTRDFTPATYTCGQHLDGKNGAAAAANKADLAEFWAFGFIQGYKNVSVPDVEIGPEFRVPVINSMLKACAADRDELVMELAGRVSERVKIAPEK